MQAQRRLVLCGYINSDKHTTNHVYMHGVDTRHPSLFDPLVSCARTLWDVEIEHGGVARAQLFLVTSLPLHSITGYIFP